jgi:predicted ester cyclase
MDAKQNKAIYRAFIQRVFNEGRVDSLDEFLAETYVIAEAPPGAPVGAEGVKEAVGMFRGAFPDLEITLDDLIGEDDWVAARSTLRGTHRGPLFGIAPTGNSVSVTSLTLVRLANGRLVESWVRNDVAGLMSQLGAKVG